MQSKIIKVLAISALSFLLFTCKEDPDFPIHDVQGYKPVYAAESEALINFGNVRAISKPGKILRYSNYLLVNEVGSGIHFYDNSNPADPIALGFLNIAGNVDMVLKENVLYVDHINSVVALDISDLGNIKELSRTNIWTMIVPPDKGYYFECVDPSKGSVTGWRKVTLSDPQCYR